MVSALINRDIRSKDERNLILRELGEQDFYRDWHKKSRLIVSRL